MKKIFKGLASTIAVLTLAACGGSNAQQGEAAESEGSSAQSSQAATGEQVEIRFTWWGDTGRNEKYNQIIDRFEEENPDIKVMREFGGWNDYWTRLTTQTGGGNAPDVISMHQFYVSDYANRGALLPLDEYVEEGLIDQSNFAEATVNSGRVGDDLYMVAKGVTMPGFAYIPAMFDEYGIEYPTDDWTYEDMEEIARQFVEATNGQIKGFTDHSGGQLQPNFGYFIRQSGKDLFTADGKIGFDEQDLVTWWTMWHEWREEGLIPDAASSSELANAALEENFFSTGQTALHQIPANQLTLYQEVFEDELELVAMPSLKGGEAGEVIEGAYLSVSANSKHPEAAARFIDFFINSEKSLEIFRVEQGAPGSSKMSEYVKTLLDPVQTKAVEYVERIVPEAKTAPFAPQGISELENVFALNAEAVAFKQMTPEEAASDFMEQARQMGFAE